MIFNFYIQKVVNRSVFALNFLIKTLFENFEGKTDLLSTLWMLKI